MHVQSHSEVSVTLSVTVSPQSGGAVPNQADMPARRPRHTPAAVPTPMPRRVPACTAPPAQKGSAINQLVVYNLF